jgi:hypothetical protein
MVLLGVGAVPWSQDREAVLAAVDSFYQLPDYVDQLAAETSSDTARKIKLKARLHELLTGPVLDRLLKWSDTATFASEEIAQVVSTFRPLGPRLSTSVTFVDSPHARVSTRFKTVHRLAAEDIDDLKQLFATYRITNTNPSEVLEKFGDRPHPGVGFEIESLRQSEIHLLQTAAGWKISDYADVIENSTLSLEWPAEPSVLRD